jgi:hypothetical protein
MELLAKKDGLWLALKEPGGTRTALINLTAANHGAISNGVLKAIHTEMRAKAKDGRADGAP